MFPSIEFAKNNTSTQPGPEVQKGRFFWFWSSSSRLIRSLGMIAPASIHDTFKYLQEFYLP
jgi:hypothetical protein